MYSLTLQLPILSGLAFECSPATLLDGVHGLLGQKPLGVRVGPRRLHHYLELSVQRFFQWKFTDAVGACKETREKTHRVWDILSPTMRSSTDVTLVTRDRRDQSFGDSQPLFQDALRTAGLVVGVTIPTDQPAPRSPHF